MHRLLLLALVGVIIGTVAACSTNTTTDTQREVLIYSGRSESLVAPVIEQFEAATGIKARVKYGSTGMLAATLLEEGRSSPADVFFAQDPGGLGSVEAMLSELPEDVLDSVPTWARSSNSTWVGTSGRQRVVVFNTNTLTSNDLPSAIWDFTAPEWKGRIGWAPTNGSFQAMVTAMRVLWGKDMTREWLLGIIANEPLEYPKNTPIVAAVGKGEVDVGFVNHYYLHRFIAEEGESFAARNHYLASGDPGGFTLVAGVGVLTTASNREGALEFVRFLLSQDAQQYFVNETYEFPVLGGIEPSALVPTLLPSVTIVPPAELTNSTRTLALLREVGLLP